MVTTPQEIKTLNENEIFVFGANESGIHGTGAAKQALAYGAEMGKYGFRGKTYGIPTKDKSIKTLPLNEIAGYVDAFIEFAKNRPDLTFLVTKIGCGLAGYTVEEIAPLFWKATYERNIALPKEFWIHLIDMKTKKYSL